MFDLNGKLKKYFLDLEKTHFFFISFKYMLECFTEKSYYIIKQILE
ncbi:hypothetical protein QY96_03749 [Bacillus thermotolerans]|nr:hypothetical protein QY96_03749 [Bacillus thermotolerans]